MTHSAKGVDSNGILQIDVILSGDVPILPDKANVIVLPYTEDYIQTGPGSIYAHSSRLFRVDGHSLPVYAWNHQISYDRDYGKMPYLVERLTADDISIDFDVSREVLQYQLTASIAKDEPSNQCPTGFFLDPEGPYCKDDDECVRSSPCSHVCSNSMGSFSCGCPTGYMLDNTGRTCADVNECREHPGACDHECMNMMGSYKCSCRNGFILVGTSSCEDVDECEGDDHGRSHECHNTLGGYRCSCPAGFKLTNQYTCTDIDECEELSHDCHSGQECQNNPGGFTCVNTCPLGFTKTDNGSCADIDECATRNNDCKFNQICLNTAGGYSCSCPRGYRSSGPNRPCVDVNECEESPSPCSYQCRNLQGGYQCLCPFGQKLLADRKSCAGLQYIDKKPPTVKCPAQNNGRPCPAPIDPAKAPCPRGYTMNNGQCVDIDECQKQSRCQHGCQNTPGSFRCTCPAGYKLSSNRRTCQDIDECVEQRVVCGPNQRCFNKRGDFECIDITCPPSYERDQITG